MTNYFPLVASSIASIFMTLLLYKYSTTKKIHHLIWTAAIFMVFFTSLLEFFSELDGWTVASYKVYYVMTAPLVALMGLGTLYLLRHKNWSKLFLVYTLVVSAVFVVAGASATVDEGAFTAPQDGTGSPSGSQIGGAAMPSYVRAMSPLLTVPGGLILILGAFYSFWLDRKRRYNLLIALGGVLYMAAGMSARLGVTGLFYAVQTASLVLLFLGFLLGMEHGAKVELPGADAQKTDA